MNNLITRTITGALFTAAIIVSAIYSPLAFAIIFLLMALLALHEFQRLVNGPHSLAAAVPGLVAGLISYLVIAAFALVRIGPEGLLFVPASFLVPLAIYPRKAKHMVRKRILADLVGVIIIVLPLAILNLYLNPYLVPAYHTPWFVLGTFLILWTHDTFAYLSGIMFGKHPLAPRISPKKSIEGSIGGFGFAIVAAYIISIFSPELDLWLWVGIAVIITLFGTLGDLAESMLKRRAGVKDSGRLLPGHGGVLDRFDSIFFVSPIVLILILLSI